MTYFRPEIEACKATCPASSRRRGKFIKLNTNENPYPASPAVGRAIAAVLERGLQRYPDPLADGLPPPGRRGAAASSPIGFSAATAATIC